MTTSDTVPPFHVSRPFLRASFVMAALVLAVVSGSAAQVRADELTVRKGHVAVICPLTVGGRFEAKTSAVTGQIAATPGAEMLDGSFSVDLRTLDTGISLRNAHLKETYLEVQRGEGYEAAVLDRIRLLGVDAESARGKIPFRGMLLLHGQVREVQGTADVARDGKGVTVKVQFPLRIDAFQFARPTYLGVGVDNEIRVEIEATLVAAAPATLSR